MSAKKSDATVISAVVRTEFGKGAARRTRRDGNVPVVLYGHGTDPQHLALPAHATFLALRGNANALLTLDIEGAEQLALTKDIQIDPVKRTIDHVDLLIVRKGEKVTVEVPVYTEGETWSGTIHTVERQSLTVTVDATAIPEQITVNIQDLEDGTIVRIADIPAIEGVEFEEDPETPVILVTTPQVEVEEDAEEAADEAAAPAEAASDDE